MMKRPQMKDWTVCGILKILLKDSYMIGEFYSMKLRNQIYRKFSKLYYVVKENSPPKKKMEYKQKNFCKYCKNATKTPS